MDVTGIHSLFKLMWRKPTDINYKKCASYLDGSRSKKYAAALVERGLRRNRSISEAVKKFPGNSMAIYDAYDLRFRDYDAFGKVLGRKPATMKELVELSNARMKRFEEKSLARFATESAARLDKKV